MANNIDMLNYTLRTHQYGHITITSFPVTTEIATCSGDYDWCDKGPHDHLKDVVNTEILVNGMLRNYTVREDDILLTVLPWDKRTESFLDKAQFTFGGREAFTMRMGGGGLDKPRGYGSWNLGRNSLEIDLAPWGRYV